MSEVKRYTLWMVSESGCELEPYSEESPDGLYVHHADYAAIEAECQRLRQAMLRLVTTHCAAATKNNATDAELEQYLSAGIAQLEAECERLRAQVSALQSDANSWQSGYDKGREDGAKAAEGWKAQHARDSAELRRMFAERDPLKACHENAQLHITGLVAERNTALKQRDKLAWVLREMFPRIDPHTPVPLNELDHCCEYVLYQERERLHKVIDDFLSELTP